MIFADTPPMIMMMPWMWPPHSNSDHQDYYIFSRGSQPKPSFPTVTVRGPYPNDDAMIMMSSTRWVVTPKLRMP